MSKTFEQNISIENILYCITDPNFLVPADAEYLQDYRDEYGTQYSTPALISKLRFYQNEVEKSYEKFYDFACKEMGNILKPGLEVLATKKTKQYFDTWEWIEETIVILLEEHADRLNLVRCEGDETFILLIDNMFSIVDADLPGRELEIYSLLEEHSYYMRQEEFLRMNQIDTTATRYASLH